MVFLLLEHIALLSVHLESLDNFLEPDGDDLAGYRFRNLLVVAFRVRDGHRDRVLLDPESCTT